MDIRTQGGSLAPGGVVGDGRYRLLAQFGIDERTGAHLWRARDGQLRRDVALTLLVGDPADAEAAQRGRRTLERAAHAAKFHDPGVARVLDVLSLGTGISSSEGLLGIVVAEWTKGTDLVDLVGEKPVEPAIAARMVQALAESVERAHQSGLVLGLDHPQRLRVTPSGRLRLAFPGPLPGATLRDDVKALGAVLYLLLTGRWPLPGGPPALRAAPRTSTGGLVPPQSVQPGVSSELSALAVRTIEDGGHGAIRTSAAILRLLGRIADEEERRRHGRPDPSVDPDGGVWTTKKPVKDAAARRKLALGVTVLVVAAVSILAWLGMMAISVFQDDPGASGPDVNLAEPTPTQQQKPPPSTRPSPASEVTGDPVSPSGITVYNPEGEGDGVSKAPLAIDGDVSTTWRTDEYRQQLPALKPGVGLVSTFGEAISLAKVKINSPSPGTEVEVRVADSPDATLSATRVVASGRLDQPDTTLTLEKPVSARYVIVWVTKLSGEAPEYASEVAELTFLPTRSG